MAKYLMAGNGFTQGAVDPLDTPWGTVFREPTSFYSDGTRVAADVIWPADPAASDGRTAPSLVMAQGFGGLRTMHVSKLAQYFAAAGYPTLIFDYRGFGDSDGERWRLMPDEQTADLANAVTYLTTLPGVDPARIGVYGTSIGGGYAIIAAAKDSQIRCVVSAVAIGNGRRWLRSLRRNWEWLDFLERIGEDRRKQVQEGSSEVVEPEEIMVRDPESVDSAKRLHALYPERAFKLTLRDAHALLDFSPDRFAPAIAPRAVMLIGIREDSLVANEETINLYECLNEPRELIWFPPIGHHSLYEGDNLDVVMKIARGWFDHHLRVPAEGDVG